MRKAGLSVVVLKEEFYEGAPDAEWLPSVKDKDWILLTRDDRWRYHAEEMKTLIRAKARAFVFVSKNANRHEITETVIGALGKMAQIIETVSPPFVAKIYLSGEVLLIYPE